MNNILLANKDRQFHLPIIFPNKTIRILISSLALGGAEKIVLEWAKAERDYGNRVQLAVLHSMPEEWNVPSNIEIIKRDSTINTAVFIRKLSQFWSKSSHPISTHLIRDETLRIMWDVGLKTIPVFHNGKAGWKNNIENMSEFNVPSIIGCSNSVSNEISSELKFHHKDIHVSTIKHCPSVSIDSLSAQNRGIVRSELNIPEDALLIGAVGAMKKQKNYSRAVEVLAEINKTREAYLCILGGVLNGESSLELNKIRDKAKLLGMCKYLRLPGFVSPIDRYLSGFDVVINTSLHEGFSIATQEALIAGLPVIATDVDGQGEIKHENLKLVDISSSNKQFALYFTNVKVRDELVANPIKRAPRLWSIPNSWEKPNGYYLETLFVTANLNAGGAQRSLVNLAKESKRNKKNFAIAVCNGSTSDYFSKTLQKSKINAFHVTKDNDVFEITRSIFSLITKHSVKNLCFWNVDPKVKLLLTKFLDKRVEITDVSPGAYAFKEMTDIDEFQNLIDFNTKDYYKSLSHLVFKHGTSTENICYKTKESRVIQNGVETLDMSVSSEACTFLVNGRISNTKHLHLIISAFKKHLMFHPGSTLKIVGQAEDKQKQYLSEIIELSKGFPIVFLGPDFTFNHFYENNYTAIIVMGTNQGCPNTVLEAMAAGIPAIANDSGGTREIVRKDNGILISEIFDEVEIIAAMNEVAAWDKEYLQRMKVNSQQFVRDNFNLNKMYSNYAEVIYECSNSSFGMLRRNY